MSVRYIPNTPIPSMSRATISLWFKNSSNAGLAEPWDWAKYPPPPDKSKGLEGVPQNGCFVFYDPYGDYPFPILPNSRPAADDLSVSAYKWYRHAAA